MIQATAEVSLEDIMLREIRPSQKMNTWESLRRSIWKSQTQDKEHSRDWQGPAGWGMRHQCLLGDGNLFGKGKCPRKAWRQWAGSSVGLHMEQWVAP